MHAIVAESENTKQRISEYFLNSKENRNREEQEKEEEEIINSFTFIDALCKILTMTINRAQDFVKVSDGNMQLKPSLGTCHIKEILDVVYRCLDCQKHGRIIKIQPLVSLG